MKTSMEGYAVLLFCSSLVSILLVSTATDTITVSQSIRDGETIVSAGGHFELGFFSLENSTKRYLGIWYKTISMKTVVWVANRENPLVDSSGVLKVTNQGNLLIFSPNESFWSTNSSRLVQNPIAKLLDSGNLVVKDANDSSTENFLWQSFDHPCDTFLPGMKIGINKVTGMQRYLSSWKSGDDPAQGDFTYGLDPRGFPQIFIKKGPNEQFRLGPWNGYRFTGTPSLKPNPVYKFGFTLNQEEIYYTYELLNTSIVTRMSLSPYGMMQQFVWVTPIQVWVLYQTGPLDVCDNYASCGAYGSCDINNSTTCGCLKGFEPKFPIGDIADWLNGCVRTTPLNCRSGDIFTRYSGVKLPDTRYAWFNENMTLSECLEVCFKNCSCTAYAAMDIKTGPSGCLLWFGDLIDIREFTENTQDIYIRMASSEGGASNSSQVGSNRKKRMRIIIISVLSVGMLFLGLGLTSYVWKKIKKAGRQGKKGHNLESSYTTEELELPLFDLAIIASATNNFSINNKLGEGGFGPVYKGMLEGGQEIAVKRLSKNSRQGLNEFKNEVILIAKLQHRNLVKLLGCCIQVDEKMLIYEFMPNKSLDYFIFDHTQRIQLDWSKRFHIINGIAQGLLYLHRDSRLRIVHRDLKAGNILLDNEMNPKISDFGLSRSFVGNETEANTNKVVGTYGYMSPEYAIDGLYSIKSDVFSFGVLLLEIVSGKRNRGFHHLDHDLNLIGHAWKLYMESKSLELIDALIGHSWNQSEGLRSIHVGLLCVQRCPEDRPNMSLVVLMLGSKGALPQPKQPGFFVERNLVEVVSSPSKCEPCSANEMTITELEAR